MAANVFPARVIELGAVGYWRIGEDSGTTASDSAGTNHGTITGSPTLNVTGSLGEGDDGAITFTAASSQWISVPDHASLDLGNGPMSYMAAFKRSSGADTNTRYIFTKGDQTPGMLLLGSGSGHVIRWDDFNWSSVCGSKTVLTDTNWHLAIGTKDTSNNWFLYLDGRDDTRLEVSGQTCVSTTTDLNIGRRSSLGDNYFDGSLDELAIFNAALTPGQVSELYSLWKSTRYTSLLAYGVSQDRERI